MTTTPTVPDPDGQHARAEPTVHDLMELAGAIRTNQEKIIELEGTNAAMVRRNRTMIKIVGGSLVLELLLTVAVALLSVGAVHTAHVATSSKRAIHQQCLNGNDYRAEDLKRWRYIINLQPSEPPTDEQRRQRSAFVQFIESVDAPRDCSKIV